MRFVAPNRAELSRETLARPPLSLWPEHADWLASAQFPAVEELNAGWDSPWRFVAQTPALLADGLHYESRIHARREIATREDNWHDFFNALVWRRYPALKQALNARQVAEIARMGDRQRSRAQCALTHFDEGGIIVVLRDPALLPLWDAHDWHGLFWRSRQAWIDRSIDAHVFGHALLEMALVPGKLITGKALAVVDPSGAGSAAAATAVAMAIATGQALNDPQELRALPISGVPGWHASTADEAFYREGECFQPLRAGRVYPAALRLG
ncbi:hypothetical protein DFR29_106241 [Tahibacter aquaticus]|uniref:DUF3025 family protein n=1 Tax=Tahibacter aquaticus TaxID=520092 RepID=A0A4R6YYI5_9GAMM|nr:DUF3025 domain-containing protein [Tahibacter aquaticus]TDR44094.1 hypothetical protein DFR29_106241 [Tahibacter aquaticus]